MTKHWEHFTHEADIGIRGIGLSLSEAFEMGALALTQVITDASLIKPLKSLQIKCQAPSLDILFADWLNALIYEMEIHNMLFCEFHVSIKNNKLKAIIKGEALDKDKHLPVINVKGATYTELKVCQLDEKSWLAQCVVDV